MGRVSLAVCAIAVFVLSVSCQTVATDAPRASTAHPLQGDWEFVSGRFTFPDGTVRTADNTALRAVKVIGPTRFAFVTLRADGTLGRAAAGRYTVDGNTYTEYLDLVSPAVAEGSTGVFTWRVDGDTWYHTGESRGTKFEEVWRRAR